MGSVGDCYDNALCESFPTVLALAMSVAVTAAAQTVTSEVRGVVTDAPGAVLAAAAVEATGPTSRYKTVSDTAGFCRCSACRPDLYVLM